MPIKRNLSFKKIFLKLSKSREDLSKIDSVLELESDSEECTTTPYSSFNADKEQEIDYVLAELLQDGKFLDNVGYIMYMWLFHIKGYKAWLNLAWFHWDESQGIGGCCG